MTNTEKPPTHVWNVNTGYCERCLHSIQDVMEAEGTIGCMTDDEINRTKERAEKWLRGMCG